MQTLYNNQARKGFTMPDTSRSAIKPTHKAIQSYYAALQSFSSLNVSPETGLRTAFQNLLTETARTQCWMLITEQTLKVGGKHIRPDGVMRDEFKPAAWLLGIQRW